MSDGKNLTKCQKGVIKDSFSVIPIKIYPRKCNNVKWSCPDNPMLPYLNFFSDDHDLGNTEQYLKDLYSLESNVCLVCIESIENKQPVSLISFYSSKKKIK